MGCLAMVAWSGAAYGQADLPSNAVAGKCYAKCMVPDQYETVTEQVLLKEASTRLEVVPAQYQTTNEQVLVKEGYRVLEIRPAQFSSNTEQLMVKDAGSRLEYVPPVYGCMDELACNFNPEANTEDGSCLSNDECISLGVYNDI